MNEQPARHIYPNRKQFLFMNSTTRHAAYGGARGGGKSWVAREIAVKYACTYGAPNQWSAGIRICFVRRTLEDLKKNHLEALKMMTRGIAKYNTNDKCFYFWNGAIIQMTYCDCDNDADHFQGIEYDIIIIEEATQLKEEWIKMIAASCRGVNEFPHRIIYTCNPGGEGHAYIKRLFVDRKFQEKENPDDYSFVQAKVTDNKILQKYSPEYMSFLDNLPPTIRAAWRDGDWNIYQGLYFPDFVDAEEHYEDGLWTHVIDPIPIRPHWTIYRGFDWGSYRPFSVGWYALDEYGTLYRFKELYGAQKAGLETMPNVGLEWSPEQVFLKIREIEMTDPALRGKTIHGIADPAIFKKTTGLSINDIALQCGVTFREADNTRLPGWMQCRYRLQFNEYGRPRFQVFNTCKEFLRCLPLWMHDETDVEDLNTDSEDHIADEWRYVCMSNPIKPIVEEPEYMPLYGADPLNMFGGRGA